MLDGEHSHGVRADRCNVERDRVRLAPSSEVRNLMGTGGAIAESMKDALRRLAKAVVVITTMRDEARFAMCATAVCEVSAEPPSMLICVNSTASIYQPLSKGEAFCINILHQSQVGIPEGCSGQLKGEDGFTSGQWVATILGPPRLLEAQASLVCQNVKSMSYGTHAIFVGDVVEVFEAGSVDPLIYVDRRYTLLERA